MCGAMAALVVVRDVADAELEGLDVGVNGSGTGVSADAPPTGVGPLDRRVIAVGGIVFVVLMALSTRYGFQRDEVYFLDCARHLQASYVDQPVLAPLLARVSLELFGVSLPGLRLWPALAAWATVVVGGLTARRVRRWPSGAAAGRDRHRHHAGPVGQRARGQHDRVRRAGVGRAGADRRPD